MGFDLRGDRGERHRMVVALTIAAQLAVPLDVGLAPRHERRAVLIEQREHTRAMLPTAPRRSSATSPKQIFVEEPMVPQIERERLSAMCVRHCHELNPATSRDRCPHSSDRPIPHEADLPLFTAQLAIFSAIEYPRAIHAAQNAWYSLPAGGKPLVISSHRSF